VIGTGCAARNERRIRRRDTRRALLPFDLLVRIGLHRTPQRDGQSLAVITVTDRPNDRDPHTHLPFSTPISSRQAGTPFNSGKLEVRSLPLPDEPFRKQP
jgi:hypothetical protein